MWLIDENFDVRLHKVLSDLGIKAQTAEHAGLKGLANGALLRSAQKLGYRVIVTRDALYAQDSGFLSGNFPEIAVVVVEVKVPQDRILDWFREEFKKVPIVPAPGKVTFWPS